MSCKRWMACLLAALCLTALTACDTRAASSVKLISAYFNIAKDGKETAATLDTAAYGSGYLAVAMYSGSGGHLALFKIEKSGGKDHITAVCEGNKAQSNGYSVNVATDGGKTVVFGDITDAAAAFNKIEITFDNGQKAAETLESGKGYIIVADGALNIQDFVLSGPDKQKASSYADFLKAGGSVTRTDLVPVTGK